MTPGHVADMLGCHPSTIRQRIRSGSLRASRSPVRRNRWKIHRESLIRWLDAAGWSHEDIRRICPMSGPLFTIGLRSGIRSKLVGGIRVDYHGAFAAATRIDRLKPWGIMFDLGELGASAIAAEIELYSNEIDRPLLIALHGDDFVNRGEFDFSISDSLPVGKIAQRLRAIKPWGAP